MAKKNYFFSTYALLDNSYMDYSGGVLDNNGYVHFVPFSASVGQKINIDTYAVSTYSLLYTGTYVYQGGVLAQNGDIHFVPYQSSIPGQKISSSGVVSTYDRSVAGSTFLGGVTAPNGDIYFMPNYSGVGLKISSDGTVTSYALVNDEYSGKYAHGVFVPQTDDIHFIPSCASTGQKINYLTGLVSTYSLVYTNSSGAHYGGVLSYDGSEIHFVPYNAPVGQKVNVFTNKVSTYSLVYTHSDAYLNGVLDQNGDIIFCPYQESSPGQKVSKNGVVSTYLFTDREGTTIYPYSSGSFVKSNGDIFFLLSNSVNYGVIQHETTLNNGLIFYAPLDEKEGIPHDIIGGLDGIISGNTKQNKSGLIGSSCQFSGSTDWIDFGRAVDLSGITSACTVSIWCYPTDQVPVGTSALISKENWSTDVNGFAITISTNGANFNAAGYVSNATTTQGYTISTGTVYKNKWTHLTFSWDGNYLQGSINGDVITTTAQSVIPICNVYALRIGHDVTSYPFYGKIDEIAIWDRALTNGEILDLYNSGSGLTYPFSKQDSLSYASGKGADYGKLPSADNNSINLTSWERFKSLLKRSVDAGSLIKDPVFSYFSLIYTVQEGYSGGVLAPNGDIHFIPSKAPVGFKLNYITGLQSTYSLIYTNSAGAYNGGVLNSVGEIHFIPLSAAVGQKINASGVVSTYALVSSNAAGWSGGVLDSSGSVHFVPLYAGFGQKVSSSGIVSTYSIIKYSFGDPQSSGGVLSPNGDIHFIPSGSDVGQKVSSSGVVSTYSLIYTLNYAAYSGGVLASNGDIHFAPYDAGAIGQKIDINGIVSTYSLILTGTSISNGGSLAPNGDIYFAPLNYSNPGQKIDANGIVSTYLINGSYGNNTGSVIVPNGDIYFIPAHYSPGQKISTMPVIPFSLGVCCSPFFNKK